MPQLKDYLKSYYYWDTCRVKGTEKMLLPSWENHDLDKRRRLKKSNQEGHIWSSAARLECDEHIGPLFTARTSGPSLSPLACCSSSVTHPYHAMIMQYKETVTYTMLSVSVYPV